MLMGEDIALLFAVGLSLFELNEASALLNATFRDWLSMDESPRNLLQCTRQYKPA